MLPFHHVCHVCGWFGPARLGSVLPEVFNGWFKPLCVVFALMGLPDKIDRERSAHPIEISTRVASHLLKNIRLHVTRL